MDEYLIGIIIEHKNDGIIFENNNHGYYLKGVGLETLALNQQLKLFVYHYQNQQYFAFSDERTKNYFTTLICINQVGPKTALKLLNSVSIEAFNHAVTNDDPTILLTCKGITKKIAFAIIRHFQTKKRFFANKADLDKKWILVFDALLKVGFSKEVINNYLMKINWEQDLEIIISNAVKILPNEYY